ncbi:MAG TPA: nicotinate-nucleotide--dimethylbenzimidazole phosphoribosyltransferase [Rectinemataceae bacterium]|nr:nicotinate-nucleotide--dimethylbenzimidazole phosphoribosyltransferase [Rectinemataceae bacterium]
MTKLEATLDNIIETDRKAEEAARTRQAALTKPAGSLGDLEELSIRIAGIQRRADPVVDPGAIFVMAGDHGVCREGVSAFPSDVTPEMVLNFVAGGAAINVLGRHAGARVVVTDVGVAYDFDKNIPIYHKKIAKGTKNLATENAMSREEALRSIEVGIEVFEAELKAKPFGISATGDMGIGNTTASTAMASVFTGHGARTLVGRGTGIDDAALERKIGVIEKALALHKPEGADPVGVLSKVGGYEIGALAGIILASAAHRIPVLVDGYISGAAALLAQAISPLSAKYMIGTHVSGDSGHGLMLDFLGLKPLLRLGMRLGEGTGAALAMLICSGACKILNEMATFESAGVSEKE